MQFHVGTADPESVAEMGKTAHVQTETCPQIRRADSSGVDVDNVVPRDETARTARGSGVNVDAARMDLDQRDAAARAVITNPLVVVGIVVTRAAQTQRRPHRARYVGVADEESGRGRAIGSSTRRE